MPTDSVRTPLIAGNWKMYKTLEESTSLARETLEALADDAGITPAGLRIGLFPTSIALAAVVRKIRECVAELGSPPAAEILVGAQNIHFEDAGAFTGEIAAPMVTAVGGNAVVLGHSERRHVFGERDDGIAKKVRQALRHSLVPILCVGEKIEERDAGATKDVVGRQFRAGVAEVKDARALAHVMVAYEPVWAIGTGRTATPEQAQEVHAFLRGEVAKAFAGRGSTANEAADRAQKTLILYGGSVKPDNASGLLAKPDIDGALVGGASLQADSFLGICKGCFAG